MIMRVSPARSKSQMIKGEKVVDNKKSGKQMFGTAEDGLGIQIQKETNKCYQWETQFLEKYRELGSRVLPYMVVRSTDILPTLVLYSLSGREAYCPNCPKHPKFSRKWENLKHFPKVHLNLVPFVWLFCPICNEFDVDIIQIILHVACCYGVTK